MSLFILSKGKILEGTDTGKEAAGAGNLIFERLFRI
jgi:hypothetical protein